MVQNVHKNWNGAYIVRIYSPNLLIRANYIFLSVLQLICSKPHCTTAVLRERQFRTVHIWFSSFHSGNKVHNLATIEIRLLQMNCMTAFLNNGLCRSGCTQNIHRAAVFSTGMSARETIVNLKKKRKRACIAVQIVKYNASISASW